MSIITPSVIAYAVDALGNKNNQFDQEDLDFFREQRSATNISFDLNAYIPPNMQDLGTRTGSLDQVVSENELGAWASLKNFVLDNYLNQSSLNATTYAKFQDGLVAPEENPEKARAAFLWLGHNEKASANVTVIPQWIATDSGKDVYTLRYVPEDHESKPAAVITIGDGTTADFYTDIANELSAQGHEVIIVGRMDDAFALGEASYGNGRKQEKNYKEQTGRTLQSALEASGLNTANDREFLLIDHSRGFHSVASWIAQFGSAEEYSGRYHILDIAGGRYLSSNSQDLANKYARLPIPFKNKIQASVCDESIDHYVPWTGGDRIAANLLLNLYNAVDATVDAGLFIASGKKTYDKGPMAGLTEVNIPCPTIHMIDPLDSNLDVSNGLRQFIESTSNQGATIVVTLKQDPTPEESLRIHEFKDELERIKEEHPGKYEVIYEDVDYAGHFLPLTQPELVASYARSQLDSFWNSDLTP